jgi:S-adenosylmethionine hydrolase
MIVLFTDFGSGDLYVGQIKAVLTRWAPHIPVVDLLHDVPGFAVVPAAHLLAALAPQFPAGSVFLAVVDPGVGSERAAVAVEADGRWFVGPDNGLLSVAAARAGTSRIWRIVWRPEGLSRSFHGRDLFAPVAAWLAAHPFPTDRLAPADSLEVRLDAGDLAEVIYIDHYGNAMTGIRAGAVPRDRELRLEDQSIPYARVYSDAGQGAVFWYENSIGLVEVAVNRGSAAAALGLKIGQPIGMS